MTQDFRCVVLCHRVIMQILDSRNESMKDKIEKE